jgi:hypothetical protein
MVTSQKMNESEIGYRGFKSGIYNNIAVKEQRVNGSWCGKNFPHLRYILVGFARNYLTKISSNQINLTKNYSQLQYKLTSPFGHPQQERKLGARGLNPGYITGFADAFLLLRYYKGIQQFHTQNLNSHSLSLVV